MGSEPQDPVFLTPCVVSGDVNLNRHVSQTYRYREQTCVFQGGGGVRKGRNGSLGLAEGSYGIENG